MNRLWSQEDTDYLKDSWGYVSLKHISNKLDRTEKAVVSKAEKLKLGPAYNNDSLISIWKITQIMQIDSRRINRWIDKFGLVAKERRMRERIIKMIDIEDLLLWLKNHQDLWSSSKIELFAFGIEPNWLKEKRKKDRHEDKERKRWTPSEDSKLLMYKKLGQLSHREMAKKLGTTKSSVDHRVLYLKNSKKIKVKSVNRKYWTEEETDLLMMLRDEYNLLIRQIAMILNRPWSGVSDKYLREKKKRGEFDLLNKQLSGEFNFISTLRFTLSEAYNECESEKEILEFTDQLYDLINFIKKERQEEVGSIVTKVIIEEIKEELKRETNLCNAFCCYENCEKCVQKYLEFKKKIGG